MTPRRAALGHPLLDCITELYRTFPAERARGIRYWHGGQSGLTEGGEILPPFVSGAPAVWTGKSGDRVFFSSNLGYAALYAAWHPSRGGLYGVEPIGELVPDPYHPPWAWSCPKARILVAYTLQADLKHQLAEAYRVFVENIPLSAFVVRPAPTVLSAALRTLSTGNHPKPQRVNDTHHTSRPEAGSEGGTAKPEHAGA